MQKLNWKPWLLGWVFGLIIGAVFMGVVITAVNDENLFALLLAGLALVAYVVQARKRNWKPSLIAILLGAVINPFPLFGLFVMGFACSWGSSAWYCF